MSKEDRNTAITIAIILLVCVLALVTVGSAVWRLFRADVEATLSNLGIFVSTNITDYNFSVPSTGLIQDSDNGANSNSNSETESNTNTDQDNIVIPNTDSNPGLNYNFPVSLKNQTVYPNIVKTTSTDGISSDFTVKGNQAVLGASESRVVIPKLNLDAPVQSTITISGSIAEGFVFHPLSEPYAVGETIIGCYRRYLPVTDPRSCWNLGSLELGDEVLITDNGTDYHYSITGINIFPSRSDLVYQSEPEIEGNYLRIVTAHPLDKLNQRLVILARQIDLSRT